MSAVGLVTARGGSKSIPRKNIVPVCGQPLIAWTIAAARASRLDRVVLSTDDPEIAAVATSFGAEVPFMRPAALAGDDSPHVNVVLHAVDMLEQHGCCPEYVMTLQPTSPLRTAADIDAALDVAAATGADAVIGVTPARQHPYLVKRVDRLGRLTDFVPCDIAYRRRQDLPQALALNGAIFLVRVDALRRERTLFPGFTVPYVMPGERSLDVDEPGDLVLVEALLAHAGATVAVPHA